MYRVEEEVFELHVTKIKKANRYKILKYLHSKGSVTRGELSRKLQLSLPTISRNVRPFLGGLVEEGGKMPSRVGRSSDILRFNYTFKKVLSFQVDRDFMMVGLGDLSGKLESFWKIEKSMYEFEDFVKAVERVLKKYSGRDDVAAVVFGISGYVKENGDFHVSVCNWEGKNARKIVDIVKKYMEGAIVAFENDANLLAFRELHMGKQTLKHLVCIYWGRGLGMGIVIDGKIYAGRGMAGEIGMTLHNSLTLEEYLHSILETESIVKEVSKSLYNICMIFDPDAVVLNGKFEKFFKDLKRLWSKEYGNPCKLKVSKGGEKAIVEGGVCYGAELFILKLTTGLKDLSKVWR